MNYRIYESQNGACLFPCVTQILIEQITNTFNENSYL
jgi:hypothetical protein